MNAPIRRLFIVVLLAISSPACLDVGDNRVELDKAVGKATWNTASIDVDGGNATVRKFEDNHLVLWGQAPTFDFSLDVGEHAGAWTVELVNVISDAELRQDGVVIPPTEGAQTTSRRFQIDLAGTTELSLTTPDQADETPFKFIAFADVQERIDDVQDIFEKMNAVPNARFCLISGDLTSEGSRSQLERFQKEMKTLSIPCFATLGNHELGAGNYFHEYFGRGNNSFVFRGVRFTLVDTASATVSPKAVKWFDGWLVDGADQAHLVMMHIPPMDRDGFRNGAFAHRAEANTILNLMAKHDVDIAIYGHVHSYYAFTYAGIPSYITGGGGSIPQKLDGIGRHFLVIDVDPNTQRFETAVERVFPD